MRFVADICKDANASITTLTLHHHRIAREGIERQGQHNPLQPFVERWPQNWDALYRQLATYCQDGLDLGRHLAYLALMTNDAPLLAQARSLIEFAPRRLRSLIDPDADISLLNAIANTAALWALSADDPHLAALRTDAYTFLLLHEFLPDRSWGLPAALEFIAIASTTRITADARREADHLIADMDPGTDRIAPAMRVISEEHLRPGAQGPAERLQAAIAARSTGPIQAALEELREFHEAIIAVAFNNRGSQHQTQPPLTDRLAELQAGPDSENRTAAWLTQVMNEIPQVSQPHTGALHLQDIIARKTREHLAAAIRWLPQSYDTQFYFHFHQSAAPLLTFLQRTTVQACVAANPHDPDWLPFRNKGT